MPQGSALSPWLFNVYLRPLASLLDTHAVFNRLYADDVQLVVDSLSNPAPGLQLASCLLDIKQWMDHNSLSLNAKKTEILISGRIDPAVFLGNWPTNLGPCPVSVNQVRVLGTIFDCNLNWIPQVNQCIRNALYYIRCLRKVKNLFSQYHRKVLVQSLVNSRMTSTILCIWVCL